MSQQPEPTLSSLATNPAPAPGSASGPAPEMRPPQPATRPAQQRIPPWLASTEIFLREFLLMFISLVIIIAPWSGELLWFLPRSRFLWDQNALIQYFPAIAHYSSTGAVRGIVSGLGLLNLWYAFHDAFRRRDG
jgi:hypothetical protein